MQQYPCVTTIPKGSKPQARLKQVEQRSAIMALFLLRDSLSCMGTYRDTTEAVVS